MYILSDYRKWYKDGSDNVDYNGDGYKNTADTIGQSTAVGNV